MSIGELAARRILNGWSPGPFPPNLEYSIKALEPIHNRARRILGIQELVGDKLSSEVSDRYLRPEDKSTKCCLCLCHSPKEVDWPAWGLVHPKHCSACDGGKFISQEEYEAGRLPQVKSTKKYSKERLVRRHMKARV